MRVFVTGASGFVGSAVVTELLAGGHEVVGLARSDTSAAAIEAAGAAVHRGSLDDVDSLRAGAATADGVIHTAFVHDFTDLDASGRIDLRAVETLGAELEGSERPLVVTSATGHLPQGRLVTEADVPEAFAGATHRIASEATALALADHGIRSSVVRLPPSVHGEGDHGFVPFLVGIAREKGVSGYIGDGSNRWPAVHRLDAAHLFRLALESTPAGSALHGVGEEGVPTREIAEAIGDRLDLPVVSIAAEDASEHFGWLARFFAADIPASSALTRELLAWQPTHARLIEDLENGHYF